MSSSKGCALTVGVGRETVRQVWKAFGLKPHVVDDFQLSPDPLFIEKLRDVVGLYLSPPVNAACFAVDEKTGIQALDRTAPCLPILPGTPKRSTHSYVRHGTAFQLDRAVQLVEGVRLADLRYTILEDIDVYLRTQGQDAVNQTLLGHRRHQLRRWSCAGR